MRILGYLIVIVLIVMGIMNGGDITAFIDLQALLIVLGTITGALLMAAGPRTVTAIGATLSGNPSPEQLQIGLRAYRTARYGALIGGMLALVVGYVHLVQNLDDSAAIGPPIATMFLGTFWALFLGYFILFPLELDIQKAASKETSDGETALDLLIFGIAGLALPAFLLNTLISAFTTVAK
jgi:flagellar motor component MotA